MDTQSQVLTTEVEFEGKTYTASYFLERDIIHANIEGYDVMTPLGAGTAEETVQTLLLEQLLTDHPPTNPPESWLDTTRP